MFKLFKFVGLKTRTRKRKTDIKRCAPVTQDLKHLKALLVQGRSFESFEQPTTASGSIAWINWRKTSGANRIAGNVHGTAREM